MVVLKSVRCKRWHCLRCKHTKDSLGFSRAYGIYTDFHKFVTLVQCHAVWIFAGHFPLSAGELDCSWNVQRAGRIVFRQEARTDSKRLHRGISRIHCL